MNTPDTRPPGYYLMPGDWNTTVQRDGLSVDEVYAVLDSFDDVYEQAMAGLAETQPKTSHGISVEEETTGE